MRKKKRSKNKSIKDTRNYVENSSQKKITELHTDSLFIREITGEKKRILTVDRSVQ